MSNKSGSSIANPTVKQGVENQFTQVAKNYATSTVHMQGDELQAMVDLAELTGNEQVLDAGCGPGHTALTFAPLVREVTALDLSGAMLDQGRKLAMARGIDNVDFQEGDVEALPYEDDSFDLIVSRYSAHHWPAPQDALAEFRRTLRKSKQKNGGLLLADVVSFEDYTTDTYLQAIEVLRDPSHVRDHTPDQWLQMLTHAGFEAQVKMEWRLRLAFKSWVARMRTPSDTVATIRMLLSIAPAEVKQNINLEGDSSFSMRCVLMLATPLR